MSIGADDDGYVPGRRDDVGALLPIVMIGAAIAGVASLLFVKPTPPPPAAQLRGCFTAVNSPSLFFDGKLLRFGQTDMPPTPYHLSLAKYGTIDVVTEAPLSLLPLGSRHVFERGNQRTIVFGRLAHIVSGQAYGVNKVSDAEYLEAFTPDVQNVRYDRASIVTCRP